MIKTTVSSKGQTYKQSPRERTATKIEVDKLGRGWTYDMERNQVKFQDNFVNLDGFTLDEAVKMLKSLKNCKGCIDSYKLTNCKKCIYCFDCSDCVDGFHLQRCTKMKRCEHCVDCDDCSDCTNLTNQAGKKRIREALELEEKRVELSSGFLLTIDDNVLSVVDPEKRNFPDVKDVMFKDVSNKTKEYVWSILEIVKELKKLPDFADIYTIYKISKDKGIDKNSKLDGVKFLKKYGK